MTGILPSVNLLNNKVNSKVFSNKGDPLRPPFILSQHLLISLHMI